MVTRSEITLFYKVNQVVERKKKTFHVDSDSLAFVFPVLIWDQTIVFVGCLLWLCLLWNRQDGFLWYLNLPFVYSHINQKTQFENPVLEAKRKKQLGQTDGGPSKSGITKCCVLYHSYLYLQVSIAHNQVGNWWRNWPCPSAGPCGVAFSDSVRFLEWFFNVKIELRPWHWFKSILVNLKLVVISNFGTFWCR